MCLKQASILICFLGVFTRFAYSEDSNCLHVENGTVIFEPFRRADLETVVKEEITVKRRTWRRNTKVHYAVCSNPATMLYVLEPESDGGCSKDIRQLARLTGLKYDCEVVSNGGFFNTKSGSCLGSVVSNGRLAQKSQGAQNAHFGVRKDGSLFTGYLGKEDLSDLSGNHSFLQLVGGVIWLVKNGVSFVQESLEIECEKTQETGGLSYFVDVLSARTAIGHDSQGNVILAQVDGKTAQEGASLWDMADLLIELGAVNAINLDGGGSSTFVVNSTVISHPSDDCPDGINKCERAVTTVVCLRRSAGQVRADLSVNASEESCEMLCKDLSRTYNKERNPLLVPWPLKIILGMIAALLVLSLSGNITAAYWYACRHNKKKVRRYPFEAEFQLLPNQDIAEDL